MHIKSCYVYMDKVHITIYQELHHYKHAWKVVLHEYSENIKASISSLYNKSSAAIEYTIHCSSESINSSNYTNISEISTFSSASNITTEFNSINVSNGSLIFGIDGNSQKLITSNETCLNISTAGLIISEGLSFNISQEIRFKKVLDLERIVSKTYTPPNRNIISKELLDAIHE